MFNGLINNIISLFGNNLNDFIIAFLLVLTIYWFVRYDIGKLLRIKNTYFDLCNNLDMIQGKGIDNLKKMDNLFVGAIFKPIKDIWSYFYEDFRSSASNGKTPSINEYFDLHTAVNVPACRKRVEAIPGIITMIGILGTILSIVAGLSGIDFSTSGDAARKSISILISVVVSALSISVVAIILSIIFQILDRHFYQSAVVQMNRFKNLAALKIPVSDDSLKLQSLITEQHKQTEQLQHLGTEISTQLSSFIGDILVPSLNKTFEDAVKNQITPSIKTMSDMLYQLSQLTIETQKDGMQQLVDAFMDKLNTSMGGQFQMLGASIQGMVESQTKAQQSISMLLDELLLNSDAQKNLNTETSAVLNIVSEYHKQVKDVNRSLLESIEKMASFNVGVRDIMENDRKILDELNEQHQTQQKENQEYFKLMDNQVSRLMEDLTVQLDAAFTRFNDITSLAFERMDATMNHTVEGISGNMKILFDSMDDQVRDISLYAKGLSEEVNELNGRLENSVNELGQQINSGVVNTLNSFDEGLSEICSRFGRVISDVRDAIEDLPLIVDAIHKTGDSNREMDK